MKRTTSKAASTSCSSIKQKMSQDQIEQVLKAKFDFARLNKVMSEFKKSLWNLESSDRHFRRQRLKDQSKFFRLLAPGRSEER